MDGMDVMDGETCLRQAYDAIFHGDFESALAWFRKAIESEPDNASFHYKASITCARSGKTALAVQYARKAAELDPDDPVYALNLQTLDAKLQTAEARRLLENPDPDIAKAKSMLTEAEVLDPLSAETKLLLALACRMQGDFRQAIAHLRNVLLLEPQHEEAGRLLREWRAERRRRIQSQYIHFKSKRNR